jgi:hypothetical protein
MSFSLECMGCREVEEGTNCHCQGEGWCWVDMAKERNKQEGTQI